MGAAAGAEARLTRRRISRDAGSGRVGRASFCGIAIAVVALCLQLVAPVLHARLPAPRRRRLGWPTIRLSISGISMLASQAGARLALATALILPALNSTFSHGIVGSRFFPATIATDDPFVADELALPTVSHQKV